MTAPTTETDFPIVFENPADAEKSWQYDPVHTPGAMPPLNFELGLGPFIEGFGWGMQPIQMNYFPFYSFGQRPAEQEGVPKSNDPGELKTAGQRWRDRVLPEAIELAEHYRTTDFDALSNEQLAAEIERLRDVMFRAGQLHTMAITPHWMGMQLLIDSYKELTGGDELSALRLAQGHLNKSVEAGERLWHVSRIAETTPAVRDHLLTANSANALDVLADIEAQPDALEFLSALRSYLDEFGWRNGNADQNRTWAEEPVVPLTMIRAYLETESYDPVAERERLAAERDAAIAETLGSLDAAGQQRMTEVLEAVECVVTLSEDHNYYLDQRLYTLPRRLTLAAGRRLASAGALADAEYVVYLRLAELLAALRDGAADTRDLTLRRKDELANYRTVTPPPYIGAPPPEGVRAAEGPVEAPPTSDGALQGLAASRGIARGPARVIRNLDQSDRLRPGDVLVCPVTQPPWTPLFGVASAIVTEVGSVLGHTAIVAREYGIPAVIAVRDATRLINDGQLIEVDGTAGVVRIIG
jgi:pyruvate,water dikinase